LSKVQKLDLSIINGEVTWINGGPGITIKLLGKDVDLTLNLGAQVSAQLKQAMDWSNSDDNATKLIHEKV
jgi:hypothetical protein